MQELKNDLLKIANEPRGQREARRLLRNKVCNALIVFLLFAIIITILMIVKADASPYHSLYPQDIL